MSGTNHMKSESLLLLMWLPGFVLVLARLSGLMLAMPFLSSTAIPRQVRLALPMGATMAIYPMVADTIPFDVTMSRVLMGLLGEFVMGLGIGLSLNIVVIGAMMAGAVIGRQGGLAIGQVFNPALDDESTMMEQVYFMVMIVIMLAAGVHRAVFAALLESFRTIPLLTFSDGASFVILAFDLLDSSFAMAIRLAGPAVIALLLMELSMGVISRAMPQLNILTVGFSIRGMLAMSIAGLSLVAADDVLLDQWAVCVEGIRSVLT